MVKLTNAYWNHDIGNYCFEGKSSSIIYAAVDEQAKIALSCHVRWAHFQRQSEASVMPRHSATMRNHAVYEPKRAPSPQNRPPVNILDLQNKYMLAIKYLRQRWSNFDPTRKYTCKVCSKRASHVNVYVPPKLPSK